MRNHNPFSNINETDCQILAALMEQRNDCKMFSSRDIDDMRLGSQKNWIRLDFGPPFPTGRVL